MLAVNQLIGFGAGGGGPMVITPLGAAVVDTANDATISFVTSVAVAASETIIIVVVTQGNRTISSITDPATNTYAQGAENGASNGSVAIWHCLNPTALSAGASIDVVLSGTNTRKLMMAFKLNRTATAFSGGTATGNSTTPSATTAGSIPANAAVFGGIAIQDGATTITEPGGIWTSDYNNNNNGNREAIDHGITASGGTVSFSCTLSSAQLWVTGVVGYS